MEMFFGDGLTYDPEQHEVLEDPPFLTGLKGRLGDKGRDLFIYRHREHNSFVLALWWKRPETGHGVMTEFEAFPLPLEQMSREKLPTDMEVATWLKPAMNRLREIEREMAAEEAEEKNRLEREAYERKEAHRRIQKVVGKVKEDHPDVTGILTGDTEWFTPTSEE